MINVCSACCAQACAVCQPKWCQHWKPTGACIPRHVLHANACVHIKACKSMHACECVHCKHARPATWSQGGMLRCLPGRGGLATAECARAAASPHERLRRLLKLRTCAPACSGDQGARSQAWRWIAQRCMPAWTGRPAAAHALHLMAPQVARVDADLLVTEVHSSC